MVSSRRPAVGVAAAAGKPGEILVAGIAGLVAGAMSMAAGEYVSVSSQSDTEQADLARERKELADYVGLGTARRAAFSVDEYDACREHVNGGVSAFRADACGCGVPPMVHLDHVYAGGGHRGREGANALTAHAHDHARDTQ